MTVPLTVPVARRPRRERPPAEPFDAAALRRSLCTAALLVLRREAAARLAEETEKRTMDPNRAGDVSQQQ